MWVFKSLSDALEIWINFSVTFEFEFKMRQFPVLEMFSLNINTETVLMHIASYCSENSSVSSEQRWLSGRASDWEPEVPGSNPVHGKSPKVLI